MKQKTVINIAVLIGIIAFNILFWKEKMGVNVLLFTFLMIGGLFLKERDIFRERNMQMISLGTIGFALMVIFNNSFYSKVLYSISSILMVGLAQQRSIRFLGYGLLIGFWSLFEAPMKGWNAIWANVDVGKKINYNRWGRNIRLFIIPLVVVGIFFFVYSLANQKFVMVFINQLDKFVQYIQQLDISWERVLFTILSFILVGGALWQNKEKIVVKEGKEVLQRRWDRRQSPKKLVPHTTMALKNEYRTAVITMVLLNILLFMLNITDVKHVWLKDVSGMNSWEMRALVHQGTYILIFSIFMAMAVVIYFFRKNLNFFPKNNILKIATYAWIIQNAILALSVGVRNIRYIEEFGLAYKRIGVFIFLVLTLAGLVTMILKVSGKKTLFYLFHRNAWIWYTVFFVTAVVNWDVYLTKYNLFSPYNAPLDAAFLIRNVSHKNIYLLEEHQDVIQQRAANTWSDDEIENAISMKKSRFKQSTKDYSWLSWNLPDNRTNQYITRD